jgi:hypothetical protein
MSVFVEDSAKPLSSAYVEVGQSGWIGDGSREDT